MARQAPDPRTGGQGPSGPQSFGPPASGPQPSGSRPSASRGIPDGAIIGVLATLLGTTALVWTATALAGLIMHGHLPHPLPFEGTPTAIRALATKPGQLGAAWPGTPASELPSPTAFWGTFFVLLVLLIALALTILTAWTRLRRASAEATAAARQREQAQAPLPPAPAMQQQAMQQPMSQQTMVQQSAVQQPVDWTGAEPLYRPDAQGFAAPRSTAAETETTTRIPAQPPAPFPPAAPAPPVAAPAAPAAARPFAFPPGAVCLLAPDPVASAAAKRRLLQRVLHQATGPVLVVTDDLDLWHDRPRHRDARLFDPLRLADSRIGTRAELPGNGAADGDPRVRWAPHSRCEDPAIALTRARALLAPTARPGNSPGEKGIQEAAQTLLRCWLHAAALDRRPFRHVLRWAGGTARQEPVTILRTADPHTSGPGWSGELQSLLANSTELREAALDRVLSALNALSELHVLKACTPESAADTLDVESFLRNRGTLYLTGDADETRVSRPTHSAMPLLTALVEDVVEHGRRMAVRSSSGRLDPPLLCVLDSVAAVAPLPGLPELMGRGGPLGLDTVAVLRSPEQARARWGDRAVHSLWTSADARILLGPASGPLPGADTEQSADPAETVSLGADELLLLRSRHPAEHVVLPSAGTAGAPTAVAN